MCGLQELFAAPHSEQDPLAALFFPQLVGNGLNSRKLGPELEQAAPFRLVALEEPLRLLGLNQSEDNGE